MILLKVNNVEKKLDIAIKIVDPTNSFNTTTNYLVRGYVLAPWGKLIRISTWH